MSSVSGYSRQAHLPLKEKVRVLLELQRQDLPLIARQRAPARVRAAVEHRTVTKARRAKAAPLHFRRLADATVRVGRRATGPRARAASQSVAVPVCRA